MTSNVSEIVKRLLEVDRIRNGEHPTIESDSKEADDAIESLLDDLAKIAQLIGGDQPGRVNHQATKSLEEAALATLTRFAEEIKKPKHGFVGPSIDGLHHVMDQLDAALAAQQGRPPGVPRRKYTNTPKTESGREAGSYTEFHESYGLIHISRGTGGSRRLFGSSLENDVSYTLRVSRGTREVGPWGEHFWTDSRVPICEVRLSAAQFVEMISTMNMGEGVPCTIDSVEGVRMDPVPSGARSEASEIQRLFKERIASSVADMKKKLDAVDSILSKKALTVADKNELRQVLKDGYSLFEDSAPFISKQFGESVEKMTAKAKTEIESFFSLAIHKMGVKALKDADGTLTLPPVGGPPKLPSSQD